MALFRATFSRCPVEWAENNYSAGQTLKNGAAADAANHDKDYGAVISLRNMEAISP